MSSLEVKPVETAAEQDAFVFLPWRLYRDDPHWIPPIADNLREMAGFAPHPFYEHNEVQSFIAFRDGVACGRVAAIVNRGHIERYKEQLGFFGFFESIDDQEVATGLFDAAKAWLGEKGLHWIRGPANASLNHEVGLLIDGFDDAPYFMMTYNRPYYARLVEGYGFQKIQDMYSFWGHFEMLQGLDKKLRFIVDEATKRFNIKIRRLDNSKFEEEVRIFLNIYNQSLGGTWGFVPISDRELAHMAHSLTYLMEPELTCIAEVDGKPVGALFCLLDFNPRIKQMDGGLFPFGFLQLLFNRRAIKRARFLSTNVIPEYQAWGVGLVMADAMVAPVIRYGITEVEFSWVLESNHLSRKSLERGGAKRTKTYRMYDYNRPADAEPPPGA